MGKETDELKASFVGFDSNGDGSLSFDEFYALLKKGDEEFPEDEACELFHSADTDMDGTVDFNEFVDYIYGNKDFGDFVGYLQEAAEEEARNIVMNKPLTARTYAAEAMRSNDGDWRKSNWQQRLAAIQQVEASGKAVPEEPKEESEPVVEAATLSEPVVKAATPAKKKESPFDGMTQEDMVNYSIHRYDLTIFAGSNDMRLMELQRFTDTLKRVSGPFDIFSVSKYIAKGTAGWVFLAEWKESGKRVAMKLIRMTQAFSGIREWYVSKLLRKAGVKNVVFTDETVRVLTRGKSIPIIEEQLVDAGPVQHYMVMIQEFMSGGSLEDLVQDDRLTTKMLLASLEDLATTLANMHAIKVTHRDIKPENVLVEMDGDTLLAAKLCDFGRAEIQADGCKEGIADDTRRFGVTLFSLATGENWLKSRLIHEKHEDLIARLTAAVESSAEEVMRKLPKLLEQILAGKTAMSEIAKKITELKEAC